MSIFRSKMRTTFCILTIFLFVSAALVGCDLAPSARITSTQTPPTRSIHVPTPTLVKQSADPGWTEIFQQKGTVEDGLTTKRAIGAFTTSKQFAIL